MFLFLLCYPVVLVAALLLYILWFEKFSRYFKLLNKIPGPPCYPIIGSFMVYILPPERLFEGAMKIRKIYYPIYKDWSLVWGVVNLSHPDDAEILLTSTEHINKSTVYKLLQPWLGTGLLTSGGAKWHARRKIITPAFHFNILQDFVKVFNDETEKLTGHILTQCHQPSIDVVPLITEFTLSSIAETSMGIKMDASDDYCRQYKKAIHNFGEMVIHRLLRPWLCSNIIFSLLPDGKVLKSYVDILHGFSRDVIKERKETLQMLTNESGNSYSSRKRVALLDLLLSAKNDGFDIDDEGIREEVDTFMFEGHDTTAVALCYVLMLLANYKRVQEEIHKEVTEVLGKRSPTFNDLKDLVYMERCLKEALRLYPSVHLISRKITSDMKTATGYIVPKGTSTHLHIFDLHRNPAYFPNPEKFDPDRFLPEATKDRHPFVYIPFSAGPRNCIGQRFAMLELKTALCGILRKFALEPVDTPETIKFKPDLVLRPQGSIRVHFRIRK